MRPQISGVLAGGWDPRQLSTGSALHRGNMRKTKTGDLLFLTMQFSPCGKERQVITDKKELESTSWALASPGSFSRMKRRYPPSLFEGHSRGGPHFSPVN